MKKLKLTFDALNVESFETVDKDLDQRGTVRGNASDSTCVERLCGCGGETEWDITCGTCRGDTCYNTCPTHFNCPTAAGYQGC